MNITDREQVQTIIWSDADCEVSVRIEGTVRFNADFTALASITQGGLVRISEDDGSVQRLLEIRPGSGGQLVFDYRVNGRVTAFTDGGDQWLQSFIPELLRNSGVAAEERAAWFIDRQGADGLLKEVAKVHGDRSQRRYLMVLIESPNASARDLTAALRTAGAELKSDRELAEVLTAASVRDLASEPLRRAFIETAGTIESDREHARVLGALLEREQLGSSDLSLLLESSLSIRSDRELASLLELVLQRGPVPSDLRDGFMRALDTIESDREYGRVAQALLQSGSGGE